MIFYLLFGIAFGIVGGMGLGGGIVLIPCLTLFLGTSQHEAQGMTLFAYIPMAIFALVLHVRKKNVQMKSALIVTLFGCVGGAVGYLLASIVDAASLKKVFAVFLLVIAVLRIYRQEIQGRFSFGKKSK